MLQPDCRLLSNWPATDGHNQITKNYITPLLQVYSENSKAHVALDKKLHRKGREQLGKYETIFEFKSMPFPLLKYNS